jgi:hypothetical protein
MRRSCRSMRQTPSSPPSGVTSTLLEELVATLRYFAWLGSAMNWPERSGDSLILWYPL